ncbi:MAG: ABC transporter permease subunit [Eubacteriales bacterium]|jgi:ABC-2 type transport system permease protein
MNIFFLELRNNRKSTIISTASICIAIILMLLFYPSMKNESMKALAGAKLEGMSPALLEALGLSHMIDFTVLTNFFGYVLQFVTLAIMILVTQRAAGLLSKEEAEGTIEYLSSKPVSRWEIFYQKALAHVAYLLFMMVAFTIVTVAAYLYVSDYTFGEALKETVIFFGSILFVSFIFSAVGILISALLKGGKGMGGFSTGIVFGTYIIGICSAIIDSLDFCIWLSPMDWIKPQKLISEDILVGEWVVGSIVIVICTAAAWLSYRRKDLLV